MSSIKPEYTYSDFISLRGESCGTGGPTKICPDDLVANLHKSITKNFNCEDTLCMKPNRFAEFKQLTEEVLSGKHSIVNIWIDIERSNSEAGVYLDMNVESSYPAAFSEELICEFRQASLKEGINVTCDRTRDSCSSIGLCSDSIPETTKYDFTAPRLSDYLKVGAGLASTIFFTYKAYQETRKVFEEDKKPVLESKAARGSTVISSEQNKSAPKASSWRALAYTVAAVGSGIFSAYAFQDL